MVFAFIIQTLDSEEPEIAYYRFYSSQMCNHSVSTEKEKHSVSTEQETHSVSTEQETHSVSTEQENIVLPLLFTNNAEKKELLNVVSSKVHMFCSLKLKQSLVPVQNKDNKTLIKGTYIERHWKNNYFSVVWEGVVGIGFSLLCDEDENIIHAQIVLDLIVTKLEKYLQLVSYPAFTLKVLDTIALIVDVILPNGKLIFLNSSLVKSLEKSLEANLQA